MSADNQAEPVAAVAPQPAAAAAAATVASSAGSEYLKRTCLICGCQTNQTINIYEPRSGPNIVQLIQAKFKFQVRHCQACNMPRRHQATKKKSISTHEMSHLS